ncbi:MAG: lysoplasmalogenase [Flavobacterium sp.]|nr:MAG: lysoplasmalogenase [Flavobacterium sp.]
MKNTLFLKTYLGFSVVYLLILFFGYEHLDFYLKPILIPLLGFGVYFHKDFPSKNILLSALLFSWIGDVILLFAGIAEIYFILGLVSFLISHIIYCILFNKQVKTIKNNKAFLLVGSLVIGVYLIGMLSALLPTLGDLKIPVIVYASIISLMLFFAFSGLLTWEKPGNQYVFIGAVVFVLSDSILAVDKFYNPIQKSSVFIMSTYLVAQYLIVTGILKLNSNHNQTLES